MASKERATEGKDGRTEQERLEELQNAVGGNAMGATKTVDL